MEIEKIRVASIQGFLKAWKSIVNEEGYSLFYRGVSKELYALRESDHPSIYRNKNWIQNEDAMFYDLVARCPEYFKDCKTAFEHLVMMQHYEYPTRLLDITSNPLVALYFACGGKAGAKNDNKMNGQVISYKVKKEDIRNYESDRVSLLANLVCVNSNIKSALFLYKHLERNYKSIQMELFNLEERNKVQKSFNSAPIHTVDLKLSLFIKALKEIDSIEKKVIKDPLNYRQDLGPYYLIKDDLINYHEEILELQEELKDKNHIERKADHEEIYKKYGGLEKKLSMIVFYLQYLFSSNNFEHLYNKYAHKIKNEKLSFDLSLIDSHDMNTIQCVFPKQNNPRLMAQQGAFLLFGFKDALSDKSIVPVIPEGMYAKDGSGKKIEIIILGYAKLKILEELKTLGISNSTMFPEIDNIANELKSHYI